MLQSEGHSYEQVLDWTREDGRSTKIGRARKEMLLEWNELSRLMIPQSCQRLVFVTVLLVMRPQFDCPVYSVSDVLIRCD